MCRFCCSVVYQCCCFVVIVVKSVLTSPLVAAAVQSDPVFGGGPCGFPGSGSSTLKFHHHPAQVLLIQGCHPNLFFCTLDRRCSVRKPKIAPFHANDSRKSHLVSERWKYSLTCSPVVHNVPKNVVTSLLPAPSDQSLSDLRVGFHLDRCPPTLVSVS